MYKGCYVYYGTWTPGFGPEGFKEMPMYLYEQVKAYLMNALDIIDFEERNVTVVMDKLGWFGVSISHPRDNKNKRLGRKIACDRMKLFRSGTIRKFMNFYHEDSWANPDG